jgi:hypothetical protein
MHRALLPSRLRQKLIATRDQPQSQVHDEYLDRLQRPIAHLLPNCEPQIAPFQQPE